MVCDAKEPKELPIPNSLAKLLGCGCLMCRYLHLNFEGGVDVAAARFAHQATVRVTAGRTLHHFMRGELRIVRKIYSCVGMWMSWLRYRFL